jgi:[acyl-carrier-protein] S-malonyltransferase
MKLKQELRSPLMFHKPSLLFPGQGAQYPGMGKDFWREYTIVRETFEEADEILGRKLSAIVFEGSEAELTETRNSQLGIYVCSMAILRVLQQLFSPLVPAFTAGLSLGEYSALTASKRLQFAEGVRLVDRRACLMNEACSGTPGTMAVLLGLEAEAVELLVQELNLPEDLWVANYNCPGQIVVSGTLRGIECATAQAKEKGAKRVLPLQVQGAFHSGLMKLAEEQLAPYIESVEMASSPIILVMNATGGPVHELNEIRKNMIKQVTHAVRWEQGVRHMMSSGVDLFIECGPGKTLAGFHKRIGGSAPCVSVETVGDISAVEKIIERGGVA